MVTILWFKTFHVSPDNFHPSPVCTLSANPSKKVFKQIFSCSEFHRENWDALPLIPYNYEKYKKYASIINIVSVEKNMFIEYESESIIEFPTETGLLTALTFDISTYHELSSRLWIFSTLDSATIFRKSVMFTHRFQYSALEFNFENSSTQVPSITGGKPLVICGGQPAISFRHRQFCVEENKWFIAWK